MKYPFYYVFALLMVQLLPVGVGAQEEEDSATATHQGSAAPASDEGRDFSTLDLEELLSITVETASKDEEPLKEAPVPMTVITSKMIREIGARNLQDVLTAYVPGITFVVDHNEMNVAMHGIYASSQQKILVMLDGHRLNSRAYSMANPDYSIGIPFDKIKQIEVLRGPGSSLYGNVALTAVVNIVTKPGGEVDGASIQLGGGEFISGYSDEIIKAKRFLRAGRTASFVYGKKFGEEHDLLVWATTFEADGQRIRIPKENDFSDIPQDGYAILGGATDPGSYDVGLKYNFGDFSLLASTRFGKVIEPFTSAGVPTGEVYDYDRYRSMWKVKSGLGSRSDHVELKYSPSISDSLKLEITAYYDRNDLMCILTADESTGGASYLDWHDDAMGGVAQARYSYDAGEFGQGNVLAGVQVDRMRLLDSMRPLQTGYDWTGFGDTNDRRVLEPGSEIIYSPFVQVKHKLFDELILNLGARYDIKDRYKGDNVLNLSPRLAVVWNPLEIFDVKVSFSQSFVDAPYWYRYNSLPAYQGSENLTPENLMSFQITPTVRLLGGRLINTLNVFYNYVYDFVYRDLDAGPTDPKYLNAGMLKSFGIEDELSFLQKYYRVRANCTYQYVLDAKDFGATGSRLHNVPPFVANLLVSFNPFLSFYQNAWFNLNARFVGEQLAPILNTFRWNEATQAAEAYSDPKNTISAYLLLNVSFQLSNLVVDGLSLDATVYNVLDKRVFQGGSVQHPYPQPGRFFMVYLTYLISGS